MVDIGKNLPGKLLLMLIVFWVVVCRERVAPVEHVADIWKEADGDRLPVLPEHIYRLVVA